MRRIPCIGMAVRVADRGRENRDAADAHACIGAGLGRAAFDPYMACVERVEIPRVRLSLLRFEALLVHEMGPDFSVGARLDRDVLGETLLMRGTQTYPVYHEDLSEVYVCELLRRVRLHRRLPVRVGLAVEKLGRAAVERGGAGDRAFLDPFDADFELRYFAEELPVGLRGASDEELEEAKRRQRNTDLVDAFVGLEVLFGVDDLPFISVEAALYAEVRRKRFGACASCRQRDIADDGGLFEVEDERFALDGVGFFRDPAALRGKEVFGFMGRIGLAGDGRHRPAEDRTRADACIHRSILN